MSFLSLFPWLQVLDWMKTRMVETIAEYDPWTPDNRVTGNLFFNKKGSFNNNSSYKAQ